MKTEISPNLPEARAHSGTSVFGLIWRNKFNFVLVGLLVMSLAVGYLVTAERMYQSESRLFVRVGRESVSLDPTATTGNFMGVPDSRERDVNAVADLLDSRLIAEMVVEHFGEQAILGESSSSDGLGSQVRRKLSALDDYNLNPLQVFSLRDKAIETFQENFSVLAMKTSSVLTLTYEAEDPQDAQEVLSFVLKTAMDEHLRIHRTQGSQEFFVAQERLLRESLSELEMELRDKKNSTGIASLVDQRKTQIDLIGTLKQNLITNSAERDAFQAEINRREEYFAQTPEQIVTHEVLGQPQAIGQTLREKLFDLEVRERELSAAYTDDHPQLQQLRKQLDDARGIKESETVPVEKMTGMNPNYQAAELALQERQALLVASQARTDALQKELAIANTELNRINDAEFDLSQLELEIELVRANYRKYSDKLEESRINEELQAARISSLTILQAPSFSKTPVSPKPLATLLVGMTIACLAGIGLALYREMSRPGFVATSTPPLKHPVRALASAQSTSANSPTRPEAATVPSALETPAHPR